MLRAACISSIVFLVVLASLSKPAIADEYIGSFESDITIARDGVLTVTETIRVNAEGQRIRRGIYRDFPLLMRDSDGKEREVGFKVVSVTRDGETEPYKIQRGSRAVRIYIGDENVFLDRGEYTYELTYKTDRQIRFFDGHDELYWNVTGNFWEFPILHAGALVKLPDGGLVDQFAYYTGPYGSKDRNAEAVITDSGNAVQFNTTDALAPREGLTILVGFHKDVVLPPSEAQRRSWYWRDHRGDIVSIIVLLAITLFYLYSWSRVGRDPPAGVVVPRWDPPHDVSPALANYIEKKGIAGKGFDAISAAILNLAVNGLITLQRAGDSLNLQLTEKKPDKPLPVGERAIRTKILAAGGHLQISDTYGKQVKKLQQAFVGAMESEHRTRFYRHNRLVTVFGVVFSVIGAIIILALGNPTDDDIGFAMFLLFATPIATVIMFNFGRKITVGQSLAKRLRAIWGLAVAGFISVLILSRFLVQFSLFFTGSVVLMSLAGLVALNVLFFFLIGAPTALGRKMMDELEGLKTYLNLAEKDRMNLTGGPQMSVQHYETLLPYAVALGLEKPWTKAFEIWLTTAAAATAAATWSPGWYHGGSFDSHHISDSMSSISSGIESSLTSAMPAPESSSSGFSGGGGSSGGGGGGGGGGGW